jgi:hypothetical protein
MDAKIENGCLIIRCEHALERQEYQELVKACRDVSGADSDVDALVAVAQHYWLMTETGLTLQ